MLKIKIHWYSGNGSHAGTERTTLQEITTRLSDAHNVLPWNGRKAVWRLATGEVARVFPVNQSHSPQASRDRVPASQSPTAGEHSAFGVSL